LLAKSQRLYLAHFIDNLIFLGYRAFTMVSLIGGAAPVSKLGGVRDGIVGMV
jgi:hypothetical protein